MCSWRTITLAAIGELDKLNEFREALPRLFHRAGKVDIEGDVLTAHLGQNYSGDVVADAPVLRKKLRRKEIARFFEKFAPTVIGIKACSASNHWARLLRSFDHTVELIEPQLVKPYVQRGKNDTADVEALYEAMSQPTMRFVPVKTAEQQAALMLVGVRDRLIRNRTQ
jgi:transposase